jgi:hypothetical protein
LDRALISELRHIDNVLQVNPGFKYFDDVQPNAYAVPDSYVSQTNGTVLLGINLLNNEVLSGRFGGVAVAGICAHECGHIIQFYTKYHNELQGPTSILLELHADFIGGYYIGRRRQFASDHVAAFARSLFNKGDYAFNSPQHHGTPDQRFDAMKKGYEIGSSGTPLDNAVAQGAQFVRGI